MYGAPVPQYMLRARHPKVCPACLREDRYARRIWDLSPVTTCPLHRCLLLDECPNCSRRLSWVRYKVSSCSCDFDWRRSETPTVSDPELEVSRQIYLRCKLQHGKGNAERKAKDNPLSKLGLKDFLSALFFIASQYAGVMDTKGKHLAPSMRSSKLHPLLCKAATVYEDWPNNYFSFLDWRRAQVPETKFAEGVRRDFAGYKSALYTQLASNRFNYMRSAFEEYLSSRWDGGYTAHLRRLSEPVRRSGKYVSRREAKKLLRVGVIGVDSLIAAGKLKAVVRYRKGGRLILIERTPLLAFKSELEQSIYLKQVEKFLGISRRRVLELVDGGLLIPLRGPNVDGCSDWKFRKKDVDSLLARVEKKLTTAKPEPCTTVSFLMAFRNLTRVNVGIAQFLQAILEDEVIPCEKTAKPGLAAFLFSKADVSDYACRQRRKQTGEAYSAPEAAKLLGVTQDVVYFLARKGMLSSRSGVNERYSDLLIGKDDLEEFSSAYIFPAKLAKQLSTRSSHLTQLWATQGIHPVSGPGVDGGRQHVFKKSDLEIINIEGTVSTTR